MHVEPFKCLKNNVEGLSNSMISLSVNELRSESLTNSKFKIPIAQR